MDNTQSPPEGQETALPSGAVQNITPAMLQAFQSQAEQDVLNDLETIAPQPVKVAFREYVKEAVKDTEGNVIPGNDGLPLTRMKPVNRIAEIETYVPAELLFQVMAQKQVYQHMQAQGTALNPAESLEFTAKQVLAVWQLTEPDMTYERLIKGLDFPKIKALFSRFFISLSGGVP